MSRANSLHVTATHDTQGAAGEAVLVGMTRAKSLHVTATHDTQGAAGEAVLVGMTRAKSLHVMRGTTCLGHTCSS